MPGVLKIGDKIPPFRLKDHQGYDLSQDYIIGTPIVLYFYPKDDTPGCTDQACAFRDSMKKFDLLQAVIIGVSPDDRDSHLKFIEKNKLKFTLLCDEKKTMSRAYGVLDEKGHIIRTTLVIDSKGIVRWIEKPVHVNGHAERVLKALEKYCKMEISHVADFKRDYEEFLKGFQKTGDDYTKLKERIMKEFGIKKSDIEKKNP